MPDKSADRATLLDIQRAALSVLGDVIGAPGSRSVALLDFPSHQNVGDSMIWLGEQNYLRSLNLRPIYSCDIVRFDPAFDRKLAGDVPILLHGGGNFGDVWPDYQQFRELVVDLFPHRKIIQLPQSIWFSSRERAAVANRRLSTHPDFTLLVRDRDSLARANEHLPDVRTVYCPDSAFGINQLDRAGTGQETLMLLRRDHEAQAADFEPLRQLRSAEVDWGLSGIDQLRWDLSRIPLRAEAVLGARSSEWLYPALARSYSRLANLNLEAGIRTLSRASLLVTDRLHAHVLALLLDVPHVVLDNGYGKIGAIYREFTHRFSSVEFAESPAAAADYVMSYRFAAN